MTNATKTAITVCAHICMIADAIMSAVIVYTVMTHGDISHYFPLLLACAAVNSGCAGAVCGVIQDIRNKREENKKTQDIIDA